MAPVLFDDSLELFMRMPTGACPPHEPWLRSPWCCGPLCYSAATLAPRIINIPLRPPRAPRPIREERSSPRYSCPAPSRPYRRKFCVVVAMLQPKAVPRKLCPIRPNRKTFPVSPNLVADIAAKKTPKKSRVEPASDDAHSDIPGFQTSYRPRSPGRTPRTTPSEADVRERAYRTRSEFRRASYFRGTGRAPPNRFARNASDWRSDWHRGWPNKRKLFYFHKENSQQCSLSSLRNHFAPCWPAPPRGICFLFRSANFHE